MHIRHAASAVRRVTFLEKSLSTPLLAITVFVWGCAPGSAPPVLPPSAEEVRSATLNGLTMTEGSITLQDGRWEGEPYQEGGASRPIVQLTDREILTGDVDRDGIPDAVIFLWESGGGSGIFFSMALIHRVEGTVKSFATVELGDRVQIRGTRLEQSVIELDLLQAGPDDPLCCPTERVTRSWEWRDGALTEREEGPTNQN